MITEARIMTAYRIFKAYRIYKTNAAEVARKETKKLDL